jgi:ABC-type maltose transport system permease subunit
MVLISEKIKLDSKIIHESITFFHYCHSLFKLITMILVLLLDNNYVTGNKITKNNRLNDYRYTWITRRVPLVEQELLTLPEHLSSYPGFSGVRVTWSLVLCVCFVDHCLSFCPFSFGYCVVCSSRILIIPLVSTNSSYSYSRKNIFNKC